jgi:hypothetical protein
MTIAGLRLRGNPWDLRAGEKTHRGHHKAVCSRRSLPVANLAANLVTCLEITQPLHYADLIDQIELR